MAIITISRGSMSGGEALAHCLAETLHYPIVGREIVLEAAESVGMSEQTLMKKMEKSPNLWSRLTSDRRLYLTAVQSALATQAAGGDLVYHGLAGHLLLKGMPNVLRVRLVAPLDDRIRELMQRRQLTHEEAEEYIHGVDEERVRWTRFVYNVDWRDPSIYDMVINLEKMSVKSACAVVVEAIRQPEFTPDADAKEMLADFALACRVKVALATNPQTRGLDLEVQAKAGVAEVIGRIPGAEMLTHTSRRTEEEIARSVQSVEGVKKVVLNVERFDAYH
jgi:cytidylate kinase